MTHRRRNLGNRGEQIAAMHLREVGYDILATNWRCPAGELDIVARDGKVLALVEVRTRRGRSFGSPEESITPAKQTRLVNVAQTYVAEHDWSGDWRIDVVAVEMTKRGRLVRVEVIKNAVEG